MTEALTERFVAAQASQIEWEGTPAYAIYEITPAPESLIVHFLNATAEPVQGLSLKVYGGMLKVGDVEAPEILLWRDTAPSIVSVQTRRFPGKDTKVKVWNVWRGKMAGLDVTQAWLGNAGMRVEPSSNTGDLLLHCSDGEGPVNFSDLEVRVTVL